MLTHDKYCVNCGLMMNNNSCNNRWDLMMSKKIDCWFPKGCLLVWEDEE